MNLSEDQLWALEKDIEKAVQAKKPLPEGVLKTISASLNQGKKLKDFLVDSSLSDGILEEVTSDLTRGGAKYAGDLLELAQSQTTSQNRETVLRRVLSMYRINDELKRPEDRDALRPVIAYLAGRTDAKSGMEAHGGSFAGLTPLQDTLKEWDLPVPESNRFGGADFKKALLHPVRTLRGDYREPAAEK